MNLAGHVALVTGAGQNIGRAIVLELARRGAHVAVNTRASRDAAEAVAREARGHGVKAAVLLGDVGRAEDVTRMAQQALAEFRQRCAAVTNRPS